MPNFFDVLFWMGMLCLVLIIGAVLRDARRDAALSPVARKLVSTARTEAAPIA